MRQTTKDFVKNVRLCIERADMAGIEQAINHPKMLFSTLALSAVARTGDRKLLEYALERAIGAPIMDLTSVFTSVVPSGQVNTTQYLLEWAQSNNTFNASNPYLRTVLSSAVEHDAVEIWRANAHQLHTIAQGFMKTYYLKAVEHESLQCLEYFKEHMDTEHVLVAAMELAVDKLKTASVQYFLQQKANPKSIAGPIAVQLCLKYNLTKSASLVPPELASMLLMLMDYASPEQMLSRYVGVTQSHPLYGVLNHINTVVRAQRQSDRLKLEVDGVQLNGIPAVRKL